jgi:hypothetical protein
LNPLSPVRTAPPQRRKPCRATPASSSTHASVVARRCGRSRVIAACSVPTARCHARRFRRIVRARPVRLHAVRGNPRVVSDTPICWHGGYLRPAFLPVCLSRCRFEPRSGSPRSSGWGQRAQALRVHPFPLPGPHSCIIGKKRTRSVSLLLRAAQRSDRRRTRRHGTA